MQQLQNVDPQLSGDYFSEGHSMSYSTMCYIQHQNWTQIWWLQLELFQSDCIVNVSDSKTAVAFISQVE